MEKSQAEKKEPVNLLRSLQRYHLPAFIAGVSLILFVVVLQNGIESSTGFATPGDQIISPIRIAFIGLGTGYYLGEALRNNNSGIVIFHVGAFLTLLLLSVLSISIQETGLILAIAVLFSLSMNISSIVETHDDIRKAFTLLSRDISRSGLIFLVATQYVVSIHIWSERSLSSLTWADKTIIFVLLSTLFVLSLDATLTASKWQKS